MDDLEVLLQQYESTAESIRQELAERTEDEKQYDDYLIGQMKKGKKFNIALRKANNRYAQEALVPDANQMADVERRYRFIIDMEKIEVMKKEMSDCNKQIDEIDRKIEEEVMKISQQNGGHSTK